MTRRRRRARATAADLPRSRRALVDGRLRRAGTSGYDEVDDLTRARRLPSPQLVGTPERATLDLNALTELGVDLVGRWAAVRDDTALFSGGLRNVFALADLKQRRLLDTFDAWARDTARTTRRSPERPEPTRVPDDLPAPARPAQRRDPHRRVGHRLPRRTTRGSTCPWSTRRATCATTAAWSTTAPGSTPSASRCCAAASRRSSTAIEDDAREVVDHLARHLAGR